jgi:peroxin-4
MMICTRRLRSEMNAMRKNPDKSIKLVPDEEDIRQWKATILGPKDSPFEGYEFDMDVKVSKTYPNTPPSIRMITKCFHANIHFVTGEICLDILKKEWTPAWSLESACRAILCLLGEPAPDSPLNCDAGNMLRAGDLVAYNSVAHMYAEEFARKVSI